MAVAMDWDGARSNPADIRVVMTNAKAGCAERVRVFLHT